MTSIALDVDRINLISKITINKILNYKYIILYHVRGGVWVFRRSVGPQVRVLLFSRLLNHIHQSFYVRKFVKWNEDYKF